VQRLVLAGGAPSAPAPTEGAGEQLGRRDRSPRERHDGRFRGEEDDYEPNQDAEKSLDPMRLNVIA
jgi:hypothetical protein